MYLQQEIHEQPAVIRRLLQEQTEPIARVAQAIRDFDPAFVCLAARGTSDYAALYAKYLFGAYARLAAMLSMPSLHTIYDTPPNLSRALTIGISQSGRAEDVRQVLADARAQGGLTLSITNYPDSPMAQTAAHHLELLAGEEVSVAATKTYTAELTVIAMLISALTQANAADLTPLPERVAETLNMSERIAVWAERYRYMDRFAVIGRGFNLCTALEISQKVNELAYITGIAYSEADFRHGPIAMATPGFPVLLVAPQGNMLPKLLDLADKLKERRAECLVISDDAGMLEKGHKQMPLPGGVPEWISPIVSVIPGQIFAMQQAVIRGHAVDKPEGLTKVTVTT